VEVLGEVRGDAGGDVCPVVGGVGVAEEGDAGGGCGSQSIQGLDGGVVGGGRGGGGVGMLTDGLAVVELLNLLQGGNCALWGRSALQDIRPRTGVHRVNVRRIGVC